MSSGRHSAARSVCLLLLGAGWLPLDAPAMGRRPSAEKERLENEYRRFDEFASSMGMGAPLALDEFVLLASNRYTSVAITTRSRRATVRGRAVFMAEPNLVLAGHPALSRRDEALTLRPILQSEWLLPPNPGREVVLDAGHGGHDTGARGPSGTLEKEMALDVARRVSRHLLAHGVAHRLTREDDRFISLPDRPKPAASPPPRLFVSIHFNSGPPQVNGVETYALSLPGTSSTNDASGEKPPAEANPGNAFDLSNIVLAWCLHDSLVGRGAGEDRGLRRARFAVLREAACPAALVECGYLSHAEEEGRIRNEAHREKIAASLASGILQYINRERQAEILRSIPRDSAARASDPVPRRLSKPADNR